MNEPSKKIAVERIFISPGHNFFGHHQQAPGQYPMLELPEVKCIAGKGLIGDRFFGFKENYKGQITFFSIDGFEDLCQKLGVNGKSPGIARRNIITRGIDLNSWIGAEFEIQGVRFEGITECTPCYWMDSAIAPNACSALQGCGGLRAKILSDGVLRSTA